MKLRLTLEDLHVDSFATLGDAFPRAGTVFGQVDETLFETCTCDEAWTRLGDCMQASRPACKQSYVACVPSDDTIGTCPVRTCGGDSCFVCAAPTVGTD